MKAAIYARVSTRRHAQTQTIEQQLSRLHAYVQQQGWTFDEAALFRDDGYSGASLNRRGLDALRDHAANAACDVIVITAPDRLARRYIHQVLLIEEFQQRGCEVVFVERPMSMEPTDQLLLQLRGAVAEYERSLISERMRRGKVAKLRAGQLLPWTRRPFGYQLDPERPRDPAGVRLDLYEAAIVQQMFAWYLEEHATLYSLAKQLQAAGIRSPRGSAYWTTGSIRAVLRNATYTGTAYGNRYRSIPAKGRRSALAPVGDGTSYTLKPQSEWIPIPVPAVVSQEVYTMAHAKLAHNQQTARRNNSQHQYLLRGLVSCGQCRLTATARTTADGRAYYPCRGRTDKLRRAEGRSCTTRYTPAQQRDEVVWHDLCAVLTEPQAIAAALERAHSGQWLPQEVQARRTTVEQGLGGIERQHTRLLEA